MKINDRFPVTEELLREVVSEGLKHGGDWCDLYFEDSSYNELLLRDGEVTSGGHHLDFGAGIRVIKGDKTGYAYTEKLDRRSLLSAAGMAASIACMSSEFAALLEVRRHKQVHPIHETHRQRNKKQGLQSHKSSGNAVIQRQRHHDVQLSRRVDLRFPPIGKRIGADHFQTGRQDGRQQRVPESAQRSGDDR